MHRGLPADRSDHAALAMKAARGVARARRPGQKEKMGRVVCHHLLRLLDEKSPAVSVKVQKATELENTRDKQISLGF